MHHIHHSALGGTARATAPLCCASLATTQSRIGQDVMGSLLASLSR